MASKVMFLAISLMCLTFLGEARPLYENTVVSGGESAEVENAKGKIGNINNPDWSFPGAPPFPFPFPGAPPFPFPFPLPPLPQIPFFPLPPVFPFPLPSFPFSPPAPEVNPVSPPPIPSI